MTQEEIHLENLVERLKERFLEHTNRHENMSWEKVEAALNKHPESLETLLMMERTGGEPDVVAMDDQGYLFYDCSIESPKGRRSYCYDEAALVARKKHKPEDSAMNCAKNMGIVMLSEEEYAHLQTLGSFDLKTSSWLRTPNEVRELGGALFGDKRYNRTFTYHNGADSYYAARGFRGKTSVPYS